MSINEENEKMSREEKSRRGLQELIEKVSGDFAAPEGLLELLQTMSKDEDLEELIAKRELESQKNEAEAMQYAEKIHDFLDSKGWHYTAMDSSGKTMLLGFTMRNSTVRLQIIVEPDACCVRFNISLMTCQEEYRIAMSDYIVELNQPLRYGAFHLDKRDGEITYRYSFSYKGMPFNAESFENYVDACIITADNNYRELGKIAYGRFSDEKKKNWFAKIKQFAVAISQ